MKIKHKFCACGCNREIFKPLQKYFSYDCMYKAEGFKVKKHKPYIRKPIKKRKKNALNAHLDALWSKAVKILGNNKCLYCGSIEGLNSHHIIGRRNFATRWNINNGVVLCPKHHVFSSKFSAHQTPTLFSDFIKEKRGDEWYSQLIMMSTIEKPDKDKLLKELREIVYGKEPEMPF